MRSTTILALLALILLQGCQKEYSASENISTATAFLELRFQNTVDGEPLQLGETYQNVFGEDFSVSKFKYYISNIVLYRNGAAFPIPDTYFLVDESNDSSKVIRVPINEGFYGDVGFLMGVDSARNVSGAQTGALDPVQDMFWTWNTGYIMMKLEGESSLSEAPNNRMQYHIGGFAGPFSAVRNLEANFFSPIEVKAGQTLIVNFTADVQRWFDGEHELPIEVHPTSMTPGEMASQYADNAASMIDVTSAEVQ